MPSQYYEFLPLGQLQKLCRDWNLSPEGSKPELVARLEDDDAVPGMTREIIDIPQEIIELVDDE